AGAGERSRKQDQKQQQEEDAVGKEVVSEQEQHSNWVREWIQQEEKTGGMARQEPKHGPGVGTTPTPTVAVTVTEVPDTTASCTTVGKPPSAFIDASRHQKPERKGPIAATATATAIATTTAAAKSLEMKLFNAASEPKDVGSSSWPADRAMAAAAADPQAAAANSRVRLDGLVRGMLEGVDIDALTVSSYESFCATWRLDDKVLEAQLLACTAEDWLRKAEDGAWLQKQVGNSYTACVWQGLAGLLWRRGGQLAGERVLLFSFGSGTIASLLSLVPRGGGSSSAGGTLAAGEAAFPPGVQPVQTEPAGRSYVDRTKAAVAVDGEEKCGQG
ncbi:hypothetical protein VaNZ11_012338, partial [Volvox africanus]